MNEDEQELVKGYKALEIPLKKWGKIVDNQILTALNTEANLKKYVKIPPKFRLKDPKSLIEKSFYRNQEYSNPLVEIIDKVGTRIVLLKSDDVEKVSNLLATVPIWKCIKTKDIKDHVPETANIFDYQSIHLVCSPLVKDSNFTDEETHIYPVKFKFVHYYNMHLQK